MAAVYAGQLNTNQDKDNGVGGVLTTETQLTLIVKPKSGDHFKHQVILEISGESSTDGPFVDIPESIVTGEGVKTVKHGGGWVKAKVLKTEGEPSDVDIWIVAR